MIDLGNFGATERFDVSPSPATFTGERPWPVYIIHADVNVRLSRTGEASATDFLLLQGEYARLVIPEGEELSYVIDGESGGYIYITPATVTP